MGVCSGRRGFQNLRCNGRGSDFFLFRSRILPYHDILTELEFICIKHDLDYVRLKSMSLLVIDVGLFDYKIASYAAMLG